MPLPPQIVAQSFLAGLSEQLRDALLATSHRSSFAAGMEQTSAPAVAACALVLDGMLRVYLTSPNQRQVTVRYARPGETLGLVHLFGARTAVRCQALSDVQLCIFPEAALRALAVREASLALAIATECAHRAADAMDELALLSFGSVRQRLARHLLDLAALAPDTGELLAQVTQKQLADATGSVREVVARALKELHASGATASCERGVLILDAARLDAESRLSP